jgi:hypothetical protein
MLGRVDHARPWPGFVLNRPASAQGRAALGGPDVRGGSGRSILTIREVSAAPGVVAQGIRRQAPQCRPKLGLVAGNPDNRSASVTTNVDSGLFAAAASWFRRVEAMARFCATHLRVGGIRQKCARQRPIIGRHDLTRPVSLPLGSNVVAAARAGDVAIAVRAACVPVPGPAAVATAVAAPVPIGCRQHDRKNEPAPSETVHARYLLGSIWRQRAR